MPIVRIDVTGPKPPEYRRAVMRGVREAIVATLGAPDERVTVHLIETDSECIDVPACRTDDFTVVEVLLYAGRTPGAKAACVAAIRDKLGAAPGIPASEVAVGFCDRDPVDLDVLPGEPRDGSRP